jgi:hypothetical protein
MALNDITINKGRGGLSRPLEGTDYVSGLLVYTGATLPSGFDSSNRIKIVYSVQDAEDLGIVNTHSGETKSAAKVVCGGTPAAGNTVKITYTGIDGLETVLDTYTLLTADAVSTTTAAAALAVAINAGTVTHGFTATSSTADLIITTKGGEGIFPNTGTPYACTVTGGGITGTVTQPTGSGSTVLGVASDIDIQHYHISEFFRQQPKGKLYVGLYATADFGTFASITLMQNYAAGTINQLGVYSKSASFATSQVNGIQSVLTTLEGLHKPMVAILGAELSTTTSLATLTDNLHTLSDPQVSVCIGQDGAATGYHLWKATGKSITNLGEMLGTVALSKVSDSIAWLGKYQVASTELDTVAFCNGQNFNDLSDSQITALDTQGFCFLRKINDLAGTFHNRPYTAVSLTSDYCFIHSNRTIFKCIKNVRATVLPAVGSPIKVNSDGTLSADTINYFKSLTAQGLDVVVRAVELSDYAALIDDSQDVLSSGLLEITVQLVPIGVADFITINIGFTDVITQ